MRVSRKYVSMDSKRKEVEQTLDIWRRSPGFGPEQWEEAIQIMAAHGIWSKAQVRATTRAPKRMVDRFMTKNDHTGGRFNPATLELIVEEFEITEPNSNLTAAIIRNGTSALVLGRLLGQTPGAVASRARKAVEG